MPGNGVRVSRYGQCLRCNASLFPYRYRSGLRAGLPFLHCGKVSDEGCSSFEPRSTIASGSSLVYFNNCGSNSEVAMAFCSAGVDIDDQSHQPALPVGILKRGLPFLSGLSFDNLPNKVMEKRLWSRSQTPPALLC